MKTQSGEQANGGCCFVTDCNAQLMTIFEEATVRCLRGATCTLHLGSQIAHTSVSSGGNQVRLVHATQPDDHACIYSSRSVNRVTFCSVPMMSKFVLFGGQRSENECGGAADKYSINDIYCRRLY